MTEPDGGPAFPIAAETSFRFEGNGMTLRDYFAGQALAGLLAGYLQVKDDTGTLSTETMYAVASGRFADAMLAEREKT